MGHNWWSAIVFTAGIGALAVHEEEPRSEKWLRRIHRAAPEWALYAGSKLETKPPTFDRNGAFYESVGYAGFGTSMYLQFRLAWKQAVSSPAPAELPFLTGMGDFFLHASYPNDDRLMSLTFGDSGLHSSGKRTVQLLWALGYEKPRYLWYLNRLHPSYRSAVGSTESIDLLHHPTRTQWSAAPEKPDLPPSNLYGDIGWATLRSGWGKNETLLAVKSGFTWNHSHADSNSFLLFHDGEYMLIDSGKTGYRSEEYDDYYRQSRAHNVVLFNGEGQPEEDTFRGSQIPGSVQHLIDAGNLKYVWADGTGPMSHLLDRNFRHFLWIGDVILIIDDLRAHEIGQFEWLLHTGGEAERNGLDLEVTKDGVQVDVRPLFPEPFPNTGFEHDFPARMNLEKRKGLPDPDDTQAVPYYSFRPAKKARRTKFITAIILNENDESTPDLKRIETPDMKGVEIRQGGRKTTVYLNLLADGRRRHLNSNLTVDGWETDAYLTVITRPVGSDTGNLEAVKRWFVADGSYLRRGDQVVLDSLSNVYATWTAQENRLEAHLQGQPVINAYVRSAGEPSEVFLNGSRVTPAYHEGRNLLHFQTDNQPQRGDR